MTRLFNRRAVVTIGIGSGQAARLDGHSMRFEVNKTLTREPNTAEIEIRNLSDTTRSRFESAQNQVVRIEAGYEEETAVIFEGELRKAWSVRDGPTLLTMIEAADGERAMRRARVNRGFAAGTSLGSVIEHVGRSLGVGVGNLVEQARTSGFEGLGRAFAEGTVVSGPSHRELSGLLDSAGLDWSVQDRVLQILPRGRSLDRTAVRLSSGTGLIGSPSIDSEGLMKADVLLIPSIAPGRLVQVDGEFVAGLYRVSRATYTGDTMANEWQIAIEGKVPRAG